MHFQSIHFNFWDEKLVSKLTQELLKVKTCSPKKKFSFPQHPQNIEETFRITHTTIYEDYVRVVGIAKVCILQKQLLSNEVIDTVENFSIVTPC